MCLGEPLSGPVTFCFALGQIRDCLEGCSTRFSRQSSRTIHAGNKTAFRRHEGVCVDQSRSDLDHQLGEGLQHTDQASA